MSGLGAVHHGDCAVLYHDVAVHEGFEHQIGERAPWLQDYRVKIIDGNCIESTEHCLKVLREAYLHSEINTLGYPKAALFGLCLALVAYN